MKRIIKYCLIALCLMVCVNMATPYMPFLLEPSIQNQIEFISTELASGADDRLQEEYPEGKTFANAIFALSLIDLSETIDLPLIDRAVLIDLCISRLLSEENKENFNQTLPLEYGAFYNGWINFTLMKYIESPLFQYSNNRDSISEHHNELSQKIIASQSNGYNELETYIGSVWQADNIIRIASIKYIAPTLEQQWTQRLLDAASNSQGLIYHGSQDQHTVRGSSQALITYLLSQLDTALANDYNNVYIDNYRQLICGVQLVKEYKLKGDQDIDSGPIILGYGSVASIMNIKTQASLNQPSRWTWGFFNTLGVPFSLFGRKYYLFQQELMFDIFMLWSSVSQ